jgi:hypothetical protein
MYIFYMSRRRRQTKKTRKSKKMDENTKTDLADIEEALRQKLQEYYKFTDYFINACGFGYLNFLDAFAEFYMTEKYPENGPLDRSVCRSLRYVFLDSFLNEIRKNCGKYTKTNKNRDSELKGLLNAHLERIGLKTIDPDEDVDVRRIVKTLGLYETKYVTCIDMLSDDLLENVKCVTLTTSRPIAVTLNPSINEEDEENAVIYKIDLNLSDLGDIDDERKISIHKANKTRCENQIREMILSKDANFIAKVTIYIRLIIEIARLKYLEGIENDKEYHNVDNFAMGNVEIEIYKMLMRFDDNIKKIVYTWKNSRVIFEIRNGKNGESDLYCTIKDNDSYQKHGWGIYTDSICHSISNFINCPIESDINHPEVLIRTFNNYGLYESAKTLGHVLRQSIQFTGKDMTSRALPVMCYTFTETDKDLIFRNGVAISKILMAGAKYFENYYREFGPEKPVELDTIWGTLRLRDSYLFAKCLSESEELRELHTKLLELYNEKQKIYNHSYLIRHLSG